MNQKTPQEVSKTPPQKAARGRHKSLKRNMYNASMADRLNSSWTTQSLSSDQVIFNNLSTLRARSREQAYNNDYVKRFISMVRTNVIGPKGVVIQSKALDRKGEPDKSTQKSIESAFKRWAKKKNCDTREALGWVQMQGIIISTIANDGEVFIRKRSTGEFAYKLELIDPELLDVTYCDTLKNGNRITFAIEYDASDRPVAYHVNQPIDSNGGYISNYNTRRYERVPADEMHHVFLSEFIGQRRGIPWTATGLQRMKLLQGYEDAALVAARIGAAKMGFFTSESGEVYEGEGIDVDGIPYEEAEPGTFGQLPPGVDFKNFDPDYPKGEFSDFMKQALRGLAAGLSVSYNTLANDLEGVNFSSMRHGAVEEREVWMCLQDWLITDLITPIFDEWLDSAVHLKRIYAPNNNGAARPLSVKRIRNYQLANFQGRRWKWIDPMKDIQAKRLEVELGVTSITDIILEKGADVDDVREKLTQDLEWSKSVGLPLFVTPMAAGPAPDKDEDEDESNENPGGKDEKE